MAHINMIGVDEADGALKELYDNYRAPWGGVDNILRIHGLMPVTLEPHMMLYRAVMFGPGPLTRRQREMIATVVSKTNRCIYCIHHHGDGLVRLTKNREFTNAIKHDFRNAGLDAAELSMLSYAEQLTANPANDHSRAVETLRLDGFSDEAILHITLIVGYFNFVNRIAAGLGVELEDYWKEDGFSDPSKPMSHD